MDSIFYKLKKLEKYEFDVFCKASKKKRFDFLRDSSKVMKYIIFCKAKKLFKTPIYFFLQAKLKKHELNLFELKKLKKHGLNYLQGKKVKNDTFISFICKYIATNLRKMDLIF